MFYEFTDSDSDVVSLDLRTVVAFQHYQDEPERIQVRTSWMNPEDDWFELEFNYNDFKKLMENKNG